MRPTVLLAGLLLLIGCGFDAPEAAPHGLTLEPLVSAPVGDPVPAFDGVRAGRWSVEVEKRWTRRVGEEAQAGRAVLALAFETHAGDGAWRTEVEVRVTEADGIAKRYVRAFDGLHFRYGYDAGGRPDPDTLRFEAVAPKGARSFLRGFWPAGLFGATPWLPAHPVREGEAWSREALGEVALPDDVVGAEDARIVTEGGGRLEAVRVLDGERTLDVRLETLLTVDGERRGVGAVEPVRLGIRDRGRATIRARDGLPLAWSLVEDIVVGETAGGTTQRMELTLTVEGRATPR